MLTVNVTNIRDHSSELRNLIGLYETTSMNIVQEIKNLNTEWHDDNSDAFFALADTQKNEIAKLVEAIQDICDRYDTIAEETVAIDASIQRVFCDQNYQGRVKNKYDTAIEKINSLIERISGSSTYFCTGGERSAINSAKNSLIKAKNKLTESSNKVDKYFSKLTKLEATITKLLAGISVDPLKELDVSAFLAL